MNRHGHQPRRYPGTEPLAYPRQFPECPHQPGLVPVQHRGPEAPDVGAGADQQHDHRQQALEVKKGRHVLEKNKIYEYIQDLVFAFILVLLFLFRLVIITNNIFLFFDVNSLF